MRLQRPVNQRFSLTGRSRRLQVILTLALSLLLAGVVGVLAVSRQPAAQADGEPELSFTEPELSFTDTGGSDEPDPAGFDSTGADGPKLAAADLSEPALTGVQAGDTEPTDAGTGGASQAPLADGAVRGDTPEPDAVAQLSPGAAAAPRDFERETPERVTPPGGTAEDGPSGSRRDPAPGDPEAGDPKAADDAAAFDARLREARIKDLMRDVKGVDGGPVSREAAAAADDAMTEVKNEFHDRISRVLGRWTDASVAGRDHPIALATGDGKDAMISLRWGAESLAAAHALGYANAETASARSREAAAPADAASAAAALSAFMFVQGDPVGAAMMAGQAAKGYAAATKLAAQSAQGAQDLTTAAVPGSLGWLAPGLGKPFEAAVSLMWATSGAARAAGDDPAARAAAAEARATVDKLAAGRFRKP
jgi:hypothetical protein